MTPNTSVEMNTPNNRQQMAALRGGYNSARSHDAVQCTRSVSRSGRLNSGSYNFSPSVYDKRSSAHAKICQHTTPVVSRNNNLSRKLNDPVFKAETVRTILRLLMSKGFGAHVTAQDLNSPTKALYCSVMEFLMLQLDPCLTLRNEEEDIPRFFKDLSCPVTITKSAVKAPGTPTTWPTLLTALAWLCELLQYYESTLAGEIQGGPAFVSEMNEATRSVGQTMQLSFRMLIDGRVDDDEASAMTCSQCDRHHEELEEQLRSLREVSENSASAVASLKQKLSDADEVQGKITKLSQDPEKLKVLLNTCQDKVNSTVNANDVSSEQLRKKTEKFEELRKENDRLQTVVDSQEINIDEVLRIEKKMKQKRKELTRLREERAVLEADTLQIEKQISSAKDEMTSNSRSVDVIRRDALENCTRLTTAKAIRNIPELNILIDDQSVDECIKQQQQSTYDTYAESHTDVQTKDGLSHRSNEGTSSTTNSWLNVDSLLGLNWKRFKLQIESTIVEEEREATKLAATQKETQKNTAETNTLKARSIAESKKVSRQIEEEERNTKHFKLKEERKLAAINEDIQTLKGSFDSFALDLTSRIQAAQTRNQELSKENLKQFAAAKTEVMAEKHVVVQMATRGAQFRNSCDAKIKQMVSDSAVACRDLQRQSSETVRRFGVYSGVGCLPYGS